MKHVVIPRPIIYLVLVIVAALVAIWINSVKIKDARSVREHRALMESYEEMERRIAEESNP